MATTNNLGTDPSASWAGKESSPCDEKRHSRLRLRLRLNSWLQSAWKGRSAGEQGRHDGAHRRLGVSRQHNYVSRRAFDYPQRTRTWPCDVDDSGARDGNIFLELAPGFRYVTDLARRRAKRARHVGQANSPRAGAKLLRPTAINCTHGVIHSYSMTLRATPSAALGSTGPHPTCPTCCDCFAMENWGNR